MNGHDLIKLGVKQGKGFGEKLKYANELLSSGVCISDIVSLIHAKYPEPITYSIEDGSKKSLNVFLEPKTEEEKDNLYSVVRNMREMMNVPFVKKGAIMPDACPQGGSKASITVGGVAASEKIHPDMHGADICCSMCITVFDYGVNPKSLLDAVQKVTHFGPVSRSRIPTLKMPEYLFKKMDENFFLKDKIALANSAFGTQGDGNHFAFVGFMKSTGQVALVTHHGSRTMGAALWKAGMKAAKEYCAIVSPETLRNVPSGVWLEPDSRIGNAYLKALEITENWTYENHIAIHNAANSIIGNYAIRGRSFNPHNFIFKRTDGLFYHAKGATPVYNSLPVIIPMNMRQPILIVEGVNNEDALGFAPHGAGRNISRTQYKKQFEGMSDKDILKEQTKDLDVRFYNDIVDISELPGAYKDAESVKSQIESFNLAKIIDEVVPYGTLMGGNFELLWKRKK